MRGCRGGPLEQHADQRFSSIDGLSFVVRQRHEINDVLAFDHSDFGHRFVVLPPPE